MVNHFLLHDIINAYLWGSIVALWREAAVVVDSKRLQFPLWLWREAEGTMTLVAVHMHHVIQTN